MELVNGRPADCAGRLEKEIRCYDLLDSLGIDFRRIDHEAAMTMEACEEIDRVLDAVICKNLLLCNRANLLNQSTIITGVPGSGKSFSAKELITFLALATQDDILVCDPVLFAVGNGYVTGETININGGMYYAP